MGTERPDVERALVLLNELCEESLEVPLSHVDSPSAEGETTDRFRELRDLIRSLAAALEAAERERDEAVRARERLEAALDGRSDPEPDPTGPCSGRGRPSPSCPCSFCRKARPAEQGQVE